MTPRQMFGKLGFSYDDMYNYSSNVLNGTVDDEQFLSFIYELDDHKEWTDEECWAKANPALGSINERKSK